MKPLFQSPEWTQIIDYLRDEKDVSLESLSTIILDSKSTIQKASILQGKIQTLDAIIDLPEILDSYIVLDNKLVERKK